MNLLDRIKELQKLEAEATPGDWYSRDEYIATIDEIDIDGEGNRRIDVPYDSYDADFIAEMRNAAPDMLSILGEIQPGDAEIFQFLLNNINIDDMERSKTCPDLTEFLYRYRAMAQLMEAKE